MIDKNRPELLDEIRKLLKRLDRRINYPCISIFDDGTGYVSWSRGGLLGSHLFYFSHLEDARDHLQSYFDDPDGLERDILGAK